MISSHLKESNKHLRNYKYFQMFFLLLFDFLEMDLCLWLSTFYSREFILIFHQHIPQVHFSWRVSVQEICSRCSQLKYHSSFILKSHLLQIIYLYEFLFSSYFLHNQLFFHEHLLLLELKYFLFEWCLLFSKDTFQQYRQLLLRR